MPTRQGEANRRISISTIAARNAVLATRAATKRWDLAIRLRTLGVNVTKVVSSRWCRARQSGELLGFGPVEENRAFDDLSDLNKDRAQFLLESERKMIALWRGPGVLVVVTHSSNLKALTEVVPGPDSVIVAEPDGDADLAHVARVNLREPADMLAGLSFNPPAFLRRCTQSWRRTQKPQRCSADRLYAAAFAVTQARSAMNPAVQICIHRCWRDRLFDPRHRWLRWVCGVRSRSLRWSRSRPCFFVMSGAAYFAGGNLSPGEREDRGNRWVLAAFGVLGLLNVYLPAYADQKEFWTIDGDTTRWIGVAIFAAGGVLRLWPVYVLGDRFSGLVAIQRGHKLVTGGIYSVIRHPSYLGLLLNSLGWGLAFRSGVGVLLTALTVVPLIARIGAEERLLHSQFGAEYDAYRARTSRLIPGLF